KRIKFLISTPVTSCFCEHESINRRRVPCCYRVTQFQAQFVVNDPSLGVLWRLLAVPGIQWRCYQVVFITPQPYDLLSQYKGANTSRQPCTAHEETFKGPDTVFLRVGSDEAEVRLGLQYELLLAVEWKVVFGVKHPLVVFDPLVLLLIELFQRRGILRIVAVVINIAPQ